MNKYENMFQKPVIPDIVYTDYNANQAANETLLNKIYGIQAESYYLTYGYYPIGLTNVINNKMIKNYTIYIKNDGESDQNYTLANLKYFTTSGIGSTCNNPFFVSSSGDCFCVQVNNQNETNIIKVEGIATDGTKIIYYYKVSPREVCFVAGTKVLTETGLINIEEIKSGMRVYSKNMETNQNELKEVLSVSKNIEYNKIYKVNIEEEYIQSTEVHPYYIKGKGFIKAKDLVIGDILIDVSGNEITIRDIEIEQLQEGIIVYNMNIAENHNYYVGEKCILVHNAADCPA